MTCFRTSGAFDRDWKHLAPEAQEFIRPFIHRLQQEDLSLDILRMRGFPRNRFRLRVGIYRIIFVRDHERILLIRVRHGKDVYRDG